jgi:cap1 methyltransferase
MDPSELICRVYDTFTEKAPPIPVPKEILPKAFEGKRKNILPQIEESEVKILHPDTRIVDMELYNQLLDVKSQYSHYDKNLFNRARSLANPFEQIGNSIFMDRASIKLANIDAVYNLTDTFGGSLKPREDGRFYYVDIAGGPGGFTQYIQYRMTDSLGYGITLKTSNNLEWNTKEINMDKFIPIYGFDGTGNLYTNWSEFVASVRIQFPSGVTLAMGDGGFEVFSERENKLENEKNEETVLLEKNEAYAQQEFKTSRLLLVQILTGIKCVRDGGKFMVKVFDTVTRLTAQLLYIVSNCFDKISIFKPISSRPANSERYLICEGKRSNTQDYEAILVEASQRYSENLNIINLIDDQNIPEEFLNWLFEQNSNSFNLQIKAGNDILSLLGGEEIILPPYNLRKALIIWNLPDENPERILIQAARDNNMYSVKLMINLQHYPRNILNSAIRIARNNSNFEIAQYLEKFQYQESNRGARPGSRVKYITKI